MHLQLGQAGFVALAGEVQLILVVLELAEIPLILI